VDQMLAGILNTHWYGDMGKDVS